MIIKTANKEQKTTKETTLTTKMTTERTSMTKKQTTMKKRKKTKMTKLFRWMGFDDCGFALPFFYPVSLNFKVKNAHIFSFTLFFMIILCKHLTDYVCFMSYNSSACLFV